VGQSSEPFGFFRESSTEDLLSAKGGWMERNIEMDTAVSKSLARASAELTAASILIRASNPPGTYFDPGIVAAQERVHDAFVAWMKYLDDCRQAQKPN
jgi:hypothetical protein